MISLHCQTGVGIGFGALSGLSGDPDSNTTLYAVENKFYKSNRFFTIDTSDYPAVVSKATTLTDPYNIFANVTETLGLDTNDFINDDFSINIDPEGIAKGTNGTFWIAHEGGKDASENPNLIFHADENGYIMNVITLPAFVNDEQTKNGLQGITYNPDRNILVACLGREWDGLADHPLILTYDLQSEDWDYFLYPLDEPESQNGGWVGLSDIAFIGDDYYQILEVDNQGNTDAAIKRIYGFSLKNTTSWDVIGNKTLVDDLLKKMMDFTGGLPLLKIKGLAADPTGRVWIVNDNDGLDDNSGETQLIDIRHPLFQRD